MDTRRLAVLCSHLSPSTGEAPLEASTSATKEGENGGGCAQDGCVFCMIGRGEAPAFKLYEDDVCLCILDSNPLTHGHALIIPKCHFPNLDVTPPSVVAAMCSKVPFLSNAIMRATQCDSFNFLVNNGKAAGQVIFHVSILHSIPDFGISVIFCSGVEPVQFVLGGRILHFVTHVLKAYYAVFVVFSLIWIFKTE